MGVLLDWIANANGGQMWRPESGLLLPNTLRVLPLLERARFFKFARGRWLELADRESGTTTRST
jgi:hypothetical protein